MIMRVDVIFGALPASGTLSLEREKQFSPLTLADPISPTPNNFSNRGISLALLGIGNMAPITIMQHSNGGQSRQRTHLPPGVPYSPSSLAKSPFTARAHPANFRSRVAALMLGLNRCS